MIYLSGDTHGNMDLENVLDFFELEVLIQPLTKEDYLIILGDTAICWDGGKGDARLRKKLLSLPVTVLWLDGNHENFELLNEYPVKKWRGGMVHSIAEGILHLMRGNCYEIDGKSFWVFGGGNSVDKWQRLEKKSWWKEEMPSEEEYRRGLCSLEQRGYEVNYILTHTAPRKVVEEICKDIEPGEERLQEYLQNVAEQTKFLEWYFGHWHLDVSVQNKYYGLYERIVKLK